MEASKTAQFIDIDTKKIMKQIGYAEDTKPSARIRSLVNDYSENYHDLVESAYSFTFRDIDRIEGAKVFLGDEQFIESRMMANLCRKSEKVAIFILTIGEYLEEMVAYLMANNHVLQGTVLDAVGSSAADNMAALIEDRIRSIVEMNNQRISRRFSPGYCDWNVRDQEVLFKILSDDTAGVRITDEYLMMPRKSVSGVIAIGDPDSGVDEYNPCLKCRKFECPGRRA